MTLAADKRTLLMAIELGLVQISSDDACSKIGSQKVAEFTSQLRTLHRQVEICCDEFDLVEKALELLRLAFSVSFGLEFVEV